MNALTFVGVARRGFRLNGVLVGWGVLIIFCNFPFSKIRSLKIIFLVIYKSGSIFPRNALNVTPHEYL